jgi:hypothetical protein
MSTTLRVDSSASSHSLPRFPILFQFERRPTRFDSFRSLLEDQGGGRGIMDAFSGIVVLDL